MKKDEDGGGGIYWWQVKWTLPSGSDNWLKHTGKELVHTFKDMFMEGENLWGNKKTELFVLLI